MDNICSACLVSGRNLYFITETGFYDIYTNILNEIPVYDLTDLCIRICWECRAVLHRFHVFKQRVKQSYTELLQYLRQPNHQKFPPTNPPNLQIHAQQPTSYPEVKLEFHIDFNDPVKVENEDGFVQDDSNNTHGVGNYIQDDEETHCEPVAFINDLDLIVRDLRPEKKSFKPSTRKTKTPKVKKKKEKITPKKTKIKSIKNDVTIDENYASDYDDAAHIDNCDEDLKEVEKEEIPEKSVDLKDFICGDCNFVCDDKEELDRHIETKHVETIPNQDGVLISGRNPVKNGSLKRVRVKEDLPDKPKCVECDKQFSSKKTYRYHRNVIHRGQNQHPCPRCDKVFQWRSNLSRHLRSHKARDSGELNCELCDKKFSSVATYRQHLKLSKKHINESDFSFVCNECGRKFISKTRLRDHIDWEHLHKVKFRCQLCNKPFKCHTSLYMHRQCVHPAAGERRAHLCHVCGKCYTNPNKLKYHIVAMHTHETPYKCSLCDTAFRWYSSLYRHTREVHYKMRLQPNRYKGKKTRKEPLPPPEH